MRRLSLVLVAVLLVATSCSVETKDFDALFGDDFNIDALETAQSSRVYDRNGTLITELRGEQNRTDVGIGEIPELVQNAVVAIEDERFWVHDGVDLKAILRAARSNVSAGGIAQGGSTITQQYVGNVFLDRSEQTGSRKVEEIFMARRFEQRYTKEFILEKYLNWVYFGNGAYGVEAAARTYFGPPTCERQTRASETDDRECLKITELTIVEAATIAGLIQAPGRFNPYINYEAARDRRDLVLLRMYANDYITEEEYETALLQPIDLVEDVPILEEEYPAAHFVEDVKQWFLDNPRFGATREERIALLFEGGLDIYTTIDLDLQAEAEAAVERVLPQTAADGSFNPDAAAVVMGVTPADDGHILAMVGGRDFFGADEDPPGVVLGGRSKYGGLDAPFAEPTTPRATAAEQNAAIPRAHLLAPRAKPVERRFDEAAAHIGRPRAEASVERRRLRMAEHRTARERPEAKTRARGKGRHIERVRGRREGRGGQEEAEGGPHHCVRAVVERCVGATTIEELVARCGHTTALF